MLLSNHYLDIKMGNIITASMKSKHDVFKFTLSFTHFYVFGAKAFYFYQQHLSSITNLKINSNIKLFMIITAA